MKRKQTRRIKAKDESKKHLRFRFFHPAGKSGHPAVIIEENGSSAKGFVVGHHPAKGKHRSYKLTENPQLLAVEANGRIKRKPEDAHVYLQIRQGRIGLDFGKAFLALFELTEKDELTIRKIVRAKKEGKPYSTYLTKEELARVWPKNKK